MHLVREAVLICSVYAGISPPAMATVLRLCWNHQHRTVLLDALDRLPRHVPTERWNQ